jgi:hypothetical protein
VRSSARSDTSDRGEGGISADPHPPLPTPEDVARLIAVSNAAKKYLEADDCNEAFLRGRLEKAVKRLYE